MLLVCNFINLRFNRYILFFIYNYSDPTCTSKNKFYNILNDNNNTKGLSYNRRPLL